MTVCVPFVVRSLPMELWSTLQLPQPSVAMIGGGGGWVCVVCSGGVCCECV